MKTARASLNITMYVDCPGCGTVIDLLKEEDTDGTAHDDEGALLRQLFPKEGSHDDFECEGVVCSECKLEFNVKGLEW